MSNFCGKLDPKEVIAEQAEELQKESKNIYIPSKILLNSKTVIKRPKKRNSRKKIRRRGKR